MERRAAGAKASHCLMRALTLSGAGQGSPTRIQSSIDTGAPSARTTRRPNPCSRSAARARWEPGRSAGMPFLHALTQHGFSMLS